MLLRVMILFISVTFAVPSAYAQRGSTIPLPQRTQGTDSEALRLMRNEKLNLILPGAMRDTNVDMWIHVTRAGDPDPMIPQFGSTSGYLIFTDLGDRIERAAFGGAGAVEDIDVYGSVEIARAVSGYDYGTLDFSVYDELTEFVAERDPKTIAVNTSSWISTADGISHSEYVKLEKILGPKYSRRIVSAENLVIEFVTRRTSREVAAQTEILALARQRNLERLSNVVPGKTRLGELRGRIYYTAVSERTAPPDARFWINDPNHVLQRGDFFTGGAGGTGSYMGFGVDTKIHAYILREGETHVPESIQYAWDQGKKAQGIMRQQIKVGMTAGESLQAIVSALEEADYIYTPFTDIGTDDYKILQRALANTNKSGFYVDLHAMGNNRNGGDSDIINRIGASISDFRQATHHLKIPENHIFAFEYAVHTNLPERPGYPMSINFSNPQVVTQYGVEWIQPPNDEIILIR